MRYLWTTYHEDGHIIDQPEDDRYSKHDDTAEWNPSSFRDIQEYKSPVAVFHLLDNKTAKFYGVDLRTGHFFINRSNFTIENTPLSNRKLIYYREVERSYENGQLGEPKIVRYVMGYEGKNAEGKVEKKVIYIDGE